MNTNEIREQLKQIEQWQKQGEERCFFLFVSDHDDVHGMIGGTGENLVGAFHAMLRGDDNVRKLISASMSQYYQFKMEQKKV